MTWLAESKTIRNIKPQFGMSSEGLNMMSNNNMPTRKTAISTSEMVTFKNFPSPFFHLKRISGSLVLWANSTFPTWIIFPSYSMNFSSVTDIKPLLGSIFASMRSHSSLCLFGYNALSLIGKMMTFNSRRHTFMCLTNCIFDILRAMFAKVWICFSRYSNRYFLSRFFGMLFTIKRIIHTFIFRFTFLRYTLMLFPKLCFYWVFRNWHTLITPIYYNIGGYKIETHENRVG